MPPEPDDDKRRLAVVLIEEVRKARSPRLSVRRAAADAGVSEGWWRQVALGWQDRGGGLRVPAIPSEDTIISMARAVGVEREVRDVLGRPTDGRVDQIRANLERAGIPAEMAAGVAKKLVQDGVPESQSGNDRTRSA